MAKLIFILILSFSLQVLVNAQNQSDFISIDCGASGGYTDRITGINYTSDSTYVETGQNVNISQEFNTNIAQQFQNIRSFPTGKRNCYKLKPSLGKNQNYLIRASFMYGNYDGLERFPEFELFLGVNKWITVRIEDSSSTKTFEIIHNLVTDYLDVCLVKIDSSTPFISMLELRAVVNDSYNTHLGSLELVVRLDCGSESNQIVRYNEDVMDRIWSPSNSESWNVINTSSPVSPNGLLPPSVVMRTAVTPQTANNSINFSWSIDQVGFFYLYLHFAELQRLNANQTRELNIYVNDSLWYGPLVPRFLSTTTVYGPTDESGLTLDVLINGTENSTLPPLLNAFEIYTLRNLTDSETDQIDVEAISNIKVAYQVQKNWQGDPCGPVDYIWDGLDCSYNNSKNVPRIISLNLSSSGLKAGISPFFARLTMLEYLDLSNNNLSGTVPEILEDLSYLRVLNLKGNNLRGPIPRVLLEKSRNGQLLISVDPDVIGNESSPPTPPSPAPSLSGNPSTSRNETSSSSLRYAYGNSQFAISCVAPITLCVYYFFLF